MASSSGQQRSLQERAAEACEDLIDLAARPGVSKTVQLDVVELLKQVLAWTPLYRPGLNRALLQAAKIGSGGCVRVLLSAGADPDTEDDNGDTPFVHAFRGHHQEAMEALHDAGATTEIAKMSLALATRDPSFVRLCHRLDIPVENEDWNGTADEVSLLLSELRLDPFEGQYGRHGFDDSPFMYLAQEGSPDILEMLVTKHPCIERYAENLRHDMINRALIKAIQHRRADNVEALIGRLGADINAKDVSGRSAFIFACGLDENIAQYLLSLGADIQVSDREGLTPLHWAACAGFRPLSASLLSRGVCVDVPANLGATPLMVACSSRHHHLVEFFLQQEQCNVNQTTPEGWAALHVAVRACAPRVVQLLLQHDADPNIQSASLTHNSDVVPASTPLLIAVALNSLRILRHLVDANADLDSAALVCTNPSTLSSSESEEECRSRVVEKQRCAPLQYSLLSRAWDIAALLIKAGCRLTPTVRKWISEDGRAPVTIPIEKRRYLQILVTAATSGPLKLKFLVRRRIRSILGRHMLRKLEQLDVPGQAKHFILMHELFRPSEGSFEV